MRVKVELIDGGQVQGDLQDERLAYEDQHRARHELPAAAVKYYTNLENRPVGGMRQRHRGVLDLRSLASFRDVQLVGTLHVFDSALNAVLEVAADDVYKLAHGEDA